VLAVLAAAVLVQVLQVELLVQPTGVAVVVVLVTTQTQQTMVALAVLAWLFSLCQPQNIQEQPQVHQQSQQAAQTLF
jgi:hypothetical protein